MMAAHGLAIFDLDGTLFRADDATVPAVQRSFRAAGLEPPPLGVIRRFIGSPTPEFHRWLVETCPPGAGREVADSVDRIEIEVVGECGVLYDGVEAALEAIRGSGVRLAICTNGLKPYVDAVMARCRLDRFFDLVRHLEPGDTGKSQMVADALSRLPERPAVMAGDRADDVRAAHDNGLPAIGITYGMGAAGEVTGADALAASPGELPELIARFLRR
jgi:phosphoglycolate phosphatase